MQPGRVAAGRCSAFPHTLPGWAWEMRWLTFILAAILLVSGGLAEPARADNAPGLHRLHLPGGGSAGGDRSSRGPRPSTRADAGPASGVDGPGRRVRALRCLSSLSHVGFHRPDTSPEAGGPRRLRVPLGERGPERPRGSRSRALGDLHARRSSPLGRGAASPAGCARLDLAPDVTAFEAFARAAATRYSGHYRDLPRVDAWQMWNEPNISDDLTPQWARRDGRLHPESTDRFRGLLNAGYRAVKAISPKALVVTAGTSPYGDPPGGRRIAPVRFWRAVLARPVHFDVVSHHPYAFFGPFHYAASSDDAAVPDMGRITRLVAAAVKKGRALPRRTKRTWVTELSWDSSPPDPQGVPAQRHARRLEGAFYVLWRQGVDTISSGFSSATWRDPTTARRSNRGPTHVGVSPSPPRRPSASRSSPSPRRGARDTSGSEEGRPTPGGSSSSAARERSGSPPRGSASAREASSTARSAGGGASSTGRGWAPRPR